MNRFVLGVAVCALAVSIARGETQTNLAEKLIGLMDVGESIEQSMAMSKAQMLKQSQQLGATVGEAGVTKIQEYQSKMMDLISSEMSWEKLKPRYIELYATTFTAEELEGLIAFYNTPIGQAFVKKQPELMQKSMLVNQAVMQSLQPKLRQLMREMLPAMPLRAPASP